MTLERVTNIIKNHGLYCVILNDTGLIGLTDKAGNVYDVIIWSNNQIHEANESMSLRTWLGY